ncbi:MAG: V-type ATP synthase subunit I [Thermoplasmatota archaeon]
MTRLLIGGHRSHEEAAINLLHAEGAIHIEDYQDPTGTTAIGTPLPRGDEVSALLVRLRGLQKALGATHPAPTNGHADMQALSQAEAAAAPALQRVSGVQAELSAVRSAEEALRPLAGLDVDTAVVGQLRSVKVVVGTTRTDPSGSLATLAGAEFNTVPLTSGFALALAVPVAQAPQADKILAESGFSPTVVPPGAGTPAARLAQLQVQEQRLAAEEAAQKELLDGVRRKWQTALATLEVFLVSEVQKTQAPLQFGVTSTTFHLEGWVPRERAASVEQAIKERCGGRLYVENLGDAPRLHEEPHGQGHGDSHEPGPTEHHEVSPKDEAPVHLKNPSLARPYEFLLGLLGRPRYQEIDPTKLMLFFFPIFFGLMVGDVVVGIVIMIVGYLLKRHKIFGIGGPAVGRALVAGGLISVLVGAVVFGEAMGIHFVTPPPEPGQQPDMSWEHILLGPTGHFPTTGFIREVTVAATGILAPKSDVHLSVNGWFNLGYYSKIHDIEALLIWAVMIGIVQLILGFILGVRNVYVSHGVKLAIQEKASWLILMAGAAAAVLGLTKAIPSWGVWVGAGMVVFALGLLWVATQKVLGAPGFVAILEALGLVGNILSYTRLAAIGASKAGMVIAITAIAFTIAGGGVVGWIIYVIGFALIIPLAILSAGLQSLRLQFVEFFQKFYQGGGRTYVPFGGRAP